MFGAGVGAEQSLACHRGNDDAISGQPQPDAEPRVRSGVAAEPNAAGGDGFHRSPGYELHESQDLALVLGVGVEAHAGLDVPQPRLRKSARCCARVDEIASRTVTMSPARGGHLMGSQRPGR